MNPYLKNKNRVALYHLIWLQIGVVHFTILYFQSGLELSYAVLDALVFNILYTIIALSLWYPTKFINLENYKPLKIIVNHFAASIFTSGIWVLAGYYVLINIFKISEINSEFLSSSLFWRFLIGILFYIIIVASNYLIIYYTNFKETTLKEAELKSLVKEIELKTLKYQINPHFIFNSLNSISSLTMTDPLKAQDMTIKLSDFLRQTLSGNEKQKTRLVDEINNAKLYLEIEKIRFGDKFSFEEQIEPECSQMMVPNMILQPLFENAIKHGVYESLEKVEIKLNCFKEKDYCKIIIQNNFDPDSVSKKGEGIGIQNIKERMKLFYNQENLLVFKKKDAIFEVIIYIPISGEKAHG